jgi:hypothetical protein
MLFKKFKSQINYFFKKIKITFHYEAIKLDNLGLEKFTNNNIQNLINVENSY